RAPRAARRVHDAAVGDRRAADRGSRPGPRAADRAERAPAASDGAPGHAAARGAAATRPRSRGGPPPLHDRPRARRTAPALGGGRRRRVSPLAPQTRVAGARSAGPRPRTPRADALPHVALTGPSVALNSTAAEPLPRLDRLGQVVDRPASSPRPRSWSCPYS